MGSNWSRHADNICYDQEDIVPRIFKAVETGNIRLFNHCCKQETVQRDLVKMRQKGLTLLHCAVRHQQIKMVETLLESYNFDANIEDDRGNTPLAELTRRDDYCIHFVQEILKVLLKYKADINASTYVNRTILLKTLVNGKYDVSKLLLKYGADPNMGDDDGLQPIHVCASYDRISLVEIVILCGADIDCQDKAGRTALYFAILGGHLDMFDLLLKRGSNPSIGSKFGTPLQTAIYKCNLKCVETLLKEGVLVNAELHEYRIFRMSYSKSYDYLNYALFVFCMKYENYRTREDDVILLDECINSLKILDLISQAVCSSQKFSKNTFFRTCWLPLKFPDSLRHNLTMQYIITRLALIHEILQQTKLQTPLPVVEADVNKGSLKMICIMRIRQLMCNNTNVIHAVEKIEFPKTLKNELLLKNL